jgi:hypothetical protein
MPNERGKTKRKNMRGTSNKNRTIICGANEKCWNLQKG